MGRAGGRPSAWTSSLLRCGVALRRSSRRRSARTIRQPQTATRHARGPSLPCEDSTALGTPACVRSCVPWPVAGITVRRWHARVMYILRPPPRVLPDVSAPCPDHYFTTTGSLRDHKRAIRKSFDNGPRVRRRPARDGRRGLTGARPAVLSGPGQDGPPGPEPYWSRPRLLRNASIFGSRPR